LLEQPSVKFFLKPSSKQKTSTNNSSSSLIKNRGVILFTQLRQILSGESARSGYLSAIDQGIISAANFLGAIIVARNVSLTGFGVYGIGFTILRLGRAIQEGLIIQPLNTYGAEGDDASFARYASTSLILQLILAAITSAGIWLIGQALTALGNDTSGPMIWGLWFSFFTTQVQEYLRRLLYTRQKTMLAVLNTAVSNIFRFAVLFWMIEEGTITGLGGLQAIGWGALAGILLGLWNGRAFWTLHVLNVRETAVRDFKFGRWVLGGVLANFVAVEFYPVMTAGMISFAAAGAYRAIQNLMAPVLTLLRATDTFFVPRLAKVSSIEGKQALTRPLKLTYLFTGLPITAWLSLVSLLAYPLMNWLYGEQYTKYAMGVPLMAAFYFVWFLYWPVQIALKAARISRPLFVANMLAMFLMFTVGLWMIYVWGVYGTIAGQLLNAVVIAIILWVAWIWEMRNPSSPLEIHAISEEEEE
jgi:O-antigen/teichoic acid export membrane protein